MPQRLVTLTIPRVGTKDLIRQKLEFLRLIDSIKVVQDHAKKDGPFRTTQTFRQAERMEGLLNFLDYCTDQIRDGEAEETGIGPEFWEPGA